MGKIYTIDEITAAVKPIAEKYGIDKVWLFGSYARGEQNSISRADSVKKRRRLQSARSRDSSTAPNRMTNRSRPTFRSAPIIR